MKKCHLRQVLFLSLAFLIMLILFISSSMTYEQQTSVPFLEKYLANQPFKETLSWIHFKYATGEVSISSLGYYKFVEFFIRKEAHFGTYFLMGLFLYLGLPYKLKWRVILVVLGAFFYASFDEFHQMLTGGRTPLFQDVMLDTFGAIVGILIALLCRYIFCSKKVAKKQSI